jgi:hypothetical protein
MVWSFSGGRCWYCGHFTNPFYNFCIDHVIPLAHGGDDEAENMVPACSDCNAQKRDLPLHVFRRRFSKRVLIMPHDPFVEAEGTFYFERVPYLVQCRTIELREFRGHPDPYGEWL